MNKMSSKLMNQLHVDESGQGLVEYALIMVLVALAGVTTLNTLAGDINNVFSGIGTVLSSYAP